MKRGMHSYDYIPINAYWFALTARAQVPTPLIIPPLVQCFVGEVETGGCLGTIRL